MMVISMSNVACYIPVEEVGCKMWFDARNSNVWLREFGSFGFGSWDMVKASLMWGRIDFGWFS